MRRCFADFSKYPLFSENGAVLIVETATRNYSMTEIAKIVESNNGKFYGAFIYHMTEETIQIALKISSENLSSIDETFDRYNYIVVHKFYHNEKDDLLKDRFGFTKIYGILIYEGSYIHTKERSDTFLYLSRFISELNKRNVTAVLHKDTAEGLQFSKVFPIFQTKKILKIRRLIIFQFWWRRHYSKCINLCAGSWHSCSWC